MLLLATLQYLFLLLYNFWNFVNAHIFVIWYVIVQNYHRFIKLYFHIIKVGPLGFNLTAKMCTADLWIAPFLLQDLLDRCAASKSKVKGQVVARTCQKVPLFTVVFTFLVKISIRYRKKNRTYFLVLRPTN